jgi:hypothetical protein
LEVAKKYWFKKSVIPGLPLPVNWQGYAAIFLPFIIGQAVLKLPTADVVYNLFGGGAAVIVSVAAVLLPVCVILAAIMLKTE